MARAKLVKAAKDYPQFGIVKGQQHYYWKLMTGPRSSRTFRQVDPPRPSQLTSSAFLGAMGDLEVEMSGFTHDDGLPETLDNYAESIRSLGQEEQDKFDNMPEGFQQGETGQLLEERANNCEAWADEIDTAAGELREKLEAIDAKAWWELDEFSDLDPEDEDFDPSTEPSEDEIESAREGERANAFDEAVQAVESANPGF